MSQHLRIVFDAGLKKPREAVVRVLEDDPRTDSIVVDTRPHGGTMTIRRTDIILSQPTTDPTTLPVIYRGPLPYVAPTLHMRSSVAAQEGLCGKGAALSLTNDPSKVTCLACQKINVKVPRVPEGQYDPNACEVCGRLDGKHDDEMCFQ